MATMAYCRFSNDVHQCDVYCYLNNENLYVTHVAAVRFVFDTPLPDPVYWTDTDAYIKRLSIISDMIETAEKKPIGLQCDGETYEDDDIAGLLKRLVSLRNMGYRVPEYVIDELREELSCENANNDLTNHGCCT